MVEEAGRQARLAAELAEWWEDTCGRSTPAHGWCWCGCQRRGAAAPSWTGSRLGSMPGMMCRSLSPSGSKGQTLQALETPGLRAQVLARALQVQVLQADLDEAAEQHRVMERLGLDEPASQAQLGLSAASLFFSGLTAGISFLLAGLAERPWRA
jgi:hypothetical protein